MKMVKPLLIAHFSELRNHTALSNFSKTSIMILTLYGHQATEKIQLHSQKRDKNFIDVKRYDTKMFKTKSMRDKICSRQQTP